MDTLPAAPPSPMRVFDTMNAYHRTAALKAAIDLDLFTAIAEGQTTAARLASRVGASEKGIRILCDYLTVIGFLEKTGADYRLAEDAAAFLNRHSPVYVGNAAEFLISTGQLASSFSDLTSAVRKGGTVVGEQGTVSDDNPIWVTFARTMGSLTAMPADILAARLGADEGAPWQVLDIAAGHGLFGLAIARHNPNATITALDWARVLEVAVENATKMGVMNRYRTRPGSAFEVDLGGPYDVVLLTNFLHHFSPAKCQTLLRRVRAAMRPGGRVATLEFIPNDDRVTPPMDASFSLIMLASTAEGDAYTYAELSGMFERAGFSRSELIRLEPTPQQVVISYA